ncbi:cell division ATP-binding protein FtsE [Enterococcus gallinarum]|uniref:cell division ATP-binding protein FtsE n=1 Tax=Enterococcus gallinarum TaxID=1353 RepID=UPI00249983D6|nr:ATP-binding cassette domain-containing protein [Enterococcus gallinarum]GMG58445.1 cell division ATP-binding protein FtsE [Enterococcus gallinarum]
MIRLTKVSKQFQNGTLALANITAEISQGEFIYVVGPSGSGKSTLFKLLLKEEELSAGSIQIGNVLLEGLKDRHLYMIRRQVGIIQQEDLLLAHMTAYQSCYPHELSVGQCKKIAIARAIVTEPAVLIADEPTANLDIKSAVEIMKLFIKINQLGATVLLATHDSTMVNTVRNRVFELKEGRLIRDDRNGGYTRYADPKDTYVW